MSKASEVEVECPECQHTQTVTFWDSLNASLDPTLREKLLKAEINQFKCIKCECTAHLTGPLLYHDMTRKFCIQYIPPADLDDPDMLNRYTVDGKIAIDLPHEKMGVGYMSEPHVCFDMNEMIRYVLFREKLFERGN